MLDSLLGGLPSPSAPPHEGARPRVVCADDSLTLLTLLQGLLGARYEVVTASNGWRALELIRASRTDVVLSDIQMPGMDGIALLAEMKRDPDLRHVPVIVMTANAAEQDAARCLDAGAHDFLEKPFGPEELRARVTAALRSHLMYRELAREHAELLRIHGLLSASEARTRAILDSTDTAIVTLGEEGTIEEMNSAAQRTFGWSMPLARGRCFIAELVSPRFHAQIADDLAAARTGQQARRAHEILGRRSDGLEFPMELRFARSEGVAGVLFCAFARDLTESKKLQMELQQAQKLEAVGRLAAGIAHEINTPIQFIGDNTKFLQEAFEQLLELMRTHQRMLASVGHPPEVLRAVAEAAEKAEFEYLVAEVPKTVARTLEGVKRVASIVRAMKEFAHPGQSELVATDVNRALEATLEIARNEYKYVAELDTDFGPISPVMANAGDLNQVFLNIIVNAAHAMGDVVKASGHPGKLRVRTAQEGSQVVIAIEDTGPGIPESIRHRIFDPFFTTKEVGRGTGQGLTLARKIVEAHQGTLTFETEAGKGTTFYIRLPLDGPKREKSPPPQEQEAADGRTRGS